MNRALTVAVGLPVRGPRLGAGAAAARGGRSHGAAPAGEPPARGGGRQRADAGRVARRRRDEAPGTDRTRAFAAGGRQRHANFHLLRARRRQFHGQCADRLRRRIQHGWRLHRATSLHGRIFLRSRAHRGLEGPARHPVWAERNRAAPSTCCRCARTSAAGAAKRAPNSGMRTRCGSTACSMSRSGNAPPCAWRAITSSTTAT